MSIVSHVEITEQFTEAGQPTRVIKVIEIFRNDKQSKEPTQSTTDQLPPVKTTGLNHFDRLPDELLERIMNFAGMRNGTSAVINLDPYEVGWKDEEEVVQDAVGFRSSMGTLRLVCWRFFYLATPLFLKRVIICDSNWGHRPLELIWRLSKLLSATGKEPSTMNQIGMSTSRNDLFLATQSHRNRRSQSESHAKVTQSNHQFSSSGLYHWNRHGGFLRALDCRARLSSDRFCGNTHPHGCWFKPVHLSGNLPRTLEPSSVYLLPLLSWIEDRRSYRKPALSPLTS